MNTPIGYIHSLDTFGAVDGPGIRYVVFFQGCPLRCIYCHNPDTWTFGEGTPTEVEELVTKIVDYRPFYRKGGVTLSGGEPLAQPEFAAALLRRLKEEGFHTAVDTAGSIPLSRCREAVDLADLLLLDIKALDPILCTEITGADGAGAKALLKLREEQGRPVWIRHVVVPGYTLDMSKLEALAEYLAPFTCIERVELLPFHQLGQHKWEVMELPYTLTGVKSPPVAEMEQAREIFRARGFSVF